MNYLKIKLLLFFILTIFFNITQAQDVIKHDSLLIVNADGFVAEWHKNAADADLVYFDKIAVDGIYIGTDATELWTKDEFYSWGKKYFDRGKAWSFTTISRNIHLSGDRKYAWFDELLETGMGLCRASGVLRAVDDSWEIVHYHLSITIPNESVDDVKEIIGKEF